MEKVYLSVIIPAYNEEKRISNTLLDIDHYLSKQDYSYEIIVVSDGSKDKTCQIVKKFTDLIKNLRLIDNKENHGKGWVVRQGMLEAQGEIRLFMDADNATTIDHFEKMIPFFEQGYQVVIGSRDKKDAAGAKQAVPQSFLKRQLGNMGNILIQLLAVSGIWDTQCGFKAFQAKAAQDIFSRSQIDRWGFDIEALALARKLGYRIGIIPVNWVNDPDSRVSWRGYLNTFRELFKIKWNFIIRKYD
jgi:glycosyltransferase involved in cell wall biosynthesis